MPRPKSSASASWPRWPGPPPPGPGPPSSPRLVRSTTAATCASTTSAAPCRASCPKRTTPGPRPVSAPGAETARLRLSKTPLGPAALRRVHGDHRLRHAGRRTTSPPRARPQQPRRHSPRPVAPKPFFVVAHVPLEDLVDETGDKSELAAELEHHGLIDVETVQRIACDATVVVAVDDALGHTMYEGRARRFPSGAQRREVIRRDRQCRFPGCANVTFAAVHHVKPWGSGGRTDLDNSGPGLQKAPWGGAPKRLVHDRQPQRGAHHRRPHRPGHGVAPFGALDPGDCSSQQGRGPAEAGCRLELAVCDVFSNAVLGGRRAASPSEAVTASLTLG